MNLKHRQVAFHLKALDQDGSFAGLASVFGNLDAYRDVVMPGAFGKTLAAWKTKDSMPPVLWQHDSAQPIGVHTAMAENGEGLYVEGQLLIGDVQKSKEAYALMKAKAVRGMSIGYDLYPDGCEYDAQNSVMQLTAIELWENSIVTFPANDQALISEVKDMLARGDQPTLKQFEKSLRELGFSKKQATAIASGGYANLLRRDAEKRESKSSGATLPSVEDVCDAISSFKFTL